LKVVARIFSLILEDDQSSSNGMGSITSVLITGPEENLVSLLLLRNEMTSVWKIKKGDEKYGVGRGAEAEIGTVGSGESQRVCFMTAILPRY
jgi:hypothetical protein